MGETEETTGGDGKGGESMMVDDLLKEMEEKGDGKQTTKSMGLNVVVPAQPGGPKRSVRPEPEVDEEIDKLTDELMPGPDKASLDYVVQRIANLENMRGDAAISLLSQPLRTWYKFLKGVGIYNTSKIESKVIANVDCSVIVAI